MELCGRVLCGPVMATMRRRLEARTSSGLGSSCRAWLAAALASRRGAWLAAALVAAPLGSIVCTPLAACGGATAAREPSAVGRADSTNAAGTASPPELPSTPEKAAPAELTVSEASDLGSRCAPILGRLVAGHEAGIAELDRLYAANPSAAGIEAQAVAKGVEKLASSGLDAADEARCKELFEKQERRAIFLHEPAESEARLAVENCVRRVDAAYGKKTMTFEEGSGDSPRQGPFCPDDFPVPPALSQLPYKSTSSDWDTPAWRCLELGMRGEQRVQLEYLAPVGGREFSCAARYLPRQGGAPIEIVRGGRQGDDGRLGIQPKATKRRMK